MEHRSDESSTLIVIRDPTNHRIIARVDPVLDRVELRPYRSRFVWIAADVFRRALDKREESR